MGYESKLYIGEHDWDINSDQHCEKLIEAIRETIKNTEEARNG